MVADGEAAEDPPLPSVASLISRDEQLGDGDLRQLLDLKSTCQEPPPVSDFVSASTALKTTFWPFIEVRDGVLYRRRPSSNSDRPCYQVLVPADLTQEFVRRVHSGFGGGHLGLRRIQKAVQQRAYWVGWATETK